MNKLEELHLDVIETNDIKCTDLSCSMTGSTHTYAVKSAEITIDIAVKFANWIRFSEYQSLFVTKEFFEEFINNQK